MNKEQGILALAFIVGASLGFSQDERIFPALSSLVDAERAFARVCSEKGIRASFEEFFADDGIAFQPHPVKYKEAVKDRPLPANPLATILHWEPIFSDVAAAGDMGYNTGPFTAIDNTPQKRPPRYGFFFSVWKKQADGNWKVALDLGTRTNEPYTGSREWKPARAMPRAAVGGKLNLEAERNHLRDADRAFLKAAQTESVVKSFARHLSEDARLHRNGVQPILGREAIVQFLSKTPLAQSGEPMYADVSQSGDLGYTYGSYEMIETGRPDAAAEKGYYARVWRRAADDQWKVVLDITSPLPPGGK